MAANDKSPLSWRRTVASMAVSISNVDGCFELGLEAGPDTNSDILERKVWLKSRVASNL